MQYTKLQYLHRNPYASPTPQSNVDERDACPNGTSGQHTQYSTHVNRPQSFSSRIGSAFQKRLKEQGKNEVAEDLLKRLEAEGTYHELTQAELTAYGLQADCGSREVPSVRSSIASSSGWKKNRTNEEKDLELVDPRNVWLGTLAIRKCREECATSIQVKGEKIADVHFELVLNVREDFLKVTDRKDAITTMFQYTLDPPYDVRFESQHLQARLCANCVSSLFGTPGSTFYKWRNDAIAGVRPGGEALRECKNGNKSFFVDLFITIFIKHFGTPQKASQGAREVALASAYADMPGLVLIDKYPYDVLHSEWVAWREEWGDEAPEVSSSTIEKAWRARLKAILPFPIAVRLII